MRGIVVFVLAFVAAGIVLFTPIWYQQTLRRASTLSVEQVKPYILVLLVLLRRLCTSQLSARLNKPVDELDSAMEDLESQHFVSREGEDVPGFKRHIWKPAF
jgi:hypothetical protein